MARQTIAREWKAVVTTREKDNFVTKTLNLGRFTQATVASKVSAAYPGFRFVPKHGNGFGGYWVSPVGDTVEVSPK